MTRGDQLEHHDENHASLLRNVVFLDRDGVINRDSPDYIKSWEEFFFLPGSIEAIARLTAAGHPIIVITNQSVIGRKMAPPDELERIFRNMRQDIEAEGGRILDILYCPHLPEENCSCRKPKPGLVLEAAKKHWIDLETAGFVGDSAKDIECARAAGCAYSILVESGRRAAAAKHYLSETGILPDRIAADLREAAEWIIHRQSGIEPC